jgi:hypothetical protein
MDLPVIMKKKYGIKGLLEKYSIVSGPSLSNHATSRPL